MTERFEGTAMNRLLQRFGRCHPFGALLVGYQVGLALHELHAAGVLHLGLAPRCLRVRADETACKIVDFEFARPMHADGEQPFDGYPMILPPERFAGAPPHPQQDIHHLGNLMFWLLTGAPVPSRGWVALGGQPRHDFFSDDADLVQHVGRALADSAREWRRRLLDSPAAAALVRPAESAEFLRDRVAPLVAWCLHPDPGRRPRTFGPILQALSDFGVPAIGRVFDDDGAEVSGMLFFGAETDPPPDLSYPDPA